MQMKSFSDQLQHQSEILKIQTLQEINWKFDTIIDALGEAKLDRETIKENIKHGNPARVPLDSQIEKLTQYVQDMHAATMKEAQHNDYVYYRIFNVIARQTGSCRQQWKKLAEILLKCFPGQHLEETLRSIDLRHTSDTDKAFEILMTWKVFAAEDTTVTCLIKALEPLRLDIASEIDEIITIQERKTNPETTSK